MPDCHPKASESVCRSHGAINIRHLEQLCNSKYVELQLHEMSASTCEMISATRIGPKLPKCLRAIAIFTCNVTDSNYC